jgi:TonB family protein
MKIMAFIRLEFILCLILTPIIVSGQKDTTIYFPKYFKVTNSKSNAAYYSHVVKQEKDFFVMMDYTLINNRWVATNYTAIRKETNNSFRLTSKSPSEKNKNVIVKRYFNSTDSGYSIRDYIDTILTQEGESKLVFPLIKFGSWRIFNSSTGKIRSMGTYNDNQCITNNYYINDNEYIDEPYVLVEKMPEYKGGDAALLHDIEEKVIYPVEAKEKNITGTVFVRFVIMNDGSIKGAEVLIKVHPLLDEAAINTVYSIPKKWKPGEQSGKKVNVFYMVPVKFTNSNTKN